MDLNKYIKQLTQSDSQPISHAMLYVLGLSEEDLANINILINLPISIVIILGTNLILSLIIIG